MAAMGARLQTLAFGLALVLMLAFPSFVSANWTHKGKGELKEDASVTISGELSVTTSVGKVTCPTSIGVTLTKSSTAGDVSSYTVSEPSKCDLTESLGAVCGTHGVTKVEKTGTWELTAKEATIEISSIDLHFYFGKCLIPSFRLKGTATATPDKASAISSLTLGGSQTLYNAVGEEVGAASWGGSPKVSPEATYGIKPETVQTKWLMENTPLSENGEMTLSGNFSFSGVKGSVTCPVNAKITLTAGEIEAGEPEGEVKSFSVSGPSECDVGGAFTPGCATHSISSVEKTGTWSVTTNGEDITVSNLSLDYKFSGCSTTTVRIQGTSTLTVEEPTAIEQVTFGGSLSVYNGFEENIGSAELGGTQAVSPSGTFAIEEGNPPPTCEGEGSPEASEWTHEGERLSESCTEEFSGPFFLIPPSEFGGFECDTDITTELKPGGGKILEFDVTGETCAGTGLYEGCELAKTELLAEATLVPTAKDFDIKTFELEIEFGGACPESLSPTILTAKSLTATPDNSSAIGAITLSGKVTEDRVSLGTEVEGEAEGELEAAHPGTFGLG